MTCNNCKRDLSDEEVAKVHDYKKTIDWSKMTYHEHIGVVIINDYAIARVCMEAPEYVGRMPVRQDVGVVPKT